MFEIIYNDSDHKISFIPYKIQFFVSTNAQHWAWIHIKGLISIIRNFWKGLPFLMNFTCCIRGSKQNIRIAEVYVAAYAILWIVLTRFTSLSSTCSTDLIGYSMKPISKRIRINLLVVYFYLFPFSHNLEIANNHATFLQCILISRIW